MKTRFALAFVSIFLLSIASLAQTYQMGKILSITKHETTQAAPGHTDAPTNPTVDNYDVIISSGGMVYTAVYHHPGDLDPTWAAGREVQVYIKGNAITVRRANGNTEKLRIVSKKPETS